MAIKRAGLSYCAALTPSTRLSLLCACICTRVNACIQTVAVRIMLDIYIYIYIFKDLVNFEVLQKVNLELFQLFWCSRQAISWTCTQHIEVDHKWTCADTLYLCTWTQPTTQLVIPPVRIIRQLQVVRCGIQHCVYTCISMYADAPAHALVLFLWNRVRNSRLCLE